MTASYADGITIKVNGVSVPISNAARQTNHAIVYYTIPTVQAGDVVTLEYNAGAGSIVSEASQQTLQNVLSQSIANNVSGGGDPIGDTLRADAVAYYTFDEASGNARLDSTTHHFDLAECADGDSTASPGAPVANLAGKVSNAVKVQDDTNSLNNLATSSAAINITTNLTIACWIKFDALTGGNLVYSQNQSFDAIVLQSAGFASQVRGPVVFSDENNNLYVIAHLPNVVITGLTVAQPNQWYHCVADYDFVNQVVTLYVNNALSWTSAVDFSGMMPPPQFVIVQIGSSNYISAADWLAVDECGIWARALSANERAYLYNSGTGRALFPAP